MSFLIFSPAIRRLTLGAVALASVSPALAQPVIVQPVIVQPVVVQPVVVQTVPDQIVIVGRYRRLPDNVDSASTVVGYADLDLSNPADRKILRHRISLTARYLCDKLGESETGSDSCRDEATRDGMHRIGTIEEHFAPRGTAWVRPPAWAPPYPQAWVAEYP